MQATLPEAGEGTTYLWFHLFLVLSLVLSSLVLSDVNSCCEQHLMTVRVQSVD